MAEFFQGIRPLELTGFVRGAVSDYEVNVFKLSEYFPNRSSASIDFQFAAGNIRGLIEAAPFRAFGSEPPIMPRQNKAVVRGKLHPISAKMELSEENLHKLLELKDNPNIDPMLRELIEDDGLLVGQQVAARLEVARGTALDKAKIAILYANGQSFDLDFQRRADFTDVAPVGGLFTAGGSTPLDALSIARQAYIDANGFPPAGMIISTAIQTALLKNADVRQYAQRWAGTPTSRIGKQTLADVLNDFELPTPTVIDEQVLVNGVATKVIRPSSVIFTPGAGEPLGATLYGTTAEARVIKGFTNPVDQPGLVAYVMYETSPVTMWTEAAALALPVVANPDLTLQMTVI